MPNIFNDLLWRNCFTCNYRWCFVLPLICFPVFWLIRYYIPVLIFNFNFWYLLYCFCSVRWEVWFQTESVIHINAEWIGYSMVERWIWEDCIEWFSVQCIVMQDHVLLFHLPSSAVNQPLVLAVTMYFLDLWWQTLEELVTVQPLLHHTWDSIFSRTVSWQSTATM